MGFNNLLQKAKAQLEVTPYQPGLVLQVKNQRDFLKAFQAILNENKTLSNHFDQLMSVDDSYDDSIHIDITVIRKVFIDGLDQLKLDLDNNQDKLDWAKLCMKAELILLALECLVFIMFPSATPFFPIFGLILLATFLLTAVVGISLQSTIIEQDGLVERLESISTSIRF